MPVAVIEKKIKSKIKSGDRVAVVENIKYPFFEDNGNEKLCKRMNDFYSAVAEKFSYHARIRLPKRIKSRRITCRLPMTLTMNYTVALCNENVISVVIDLAFTEGRNLKTRRFSQVWGVKKQDILSYSEILKQGRKERKKIYSYVVSIAKKNGENPAFGYFGDYLMKLTKHFDLRNLFIVPKGICFFVNAGILSPAKYGANNFVLGFDSLEGLIYEEFLPEGVEKGLQNENIVNNI